MNKIDIAKVLFTDLRWQDFDDVRELVKSFSYPIGDRASPYYSGILIVVRAAIDNKPIDVEGIPHWDEILEKAHDEGCDFIVIWNVR